MNAKQKRRGIAENGDGASDGPLIVSIINGEDLGALVRYAFEAGKPEVLLNQLKSIRKKKEVEIEELCKLHYEEFIVAVDELRGVLIDASEMKSNLSSENHRLQEVASTLLLKIDELLELYSVKKNVTEAIWTLKFCVQVLSLCSKCNLYVSEGRFHTVLGALDLIERDYLQSIPFKVLRKVIERQIPLLKSHIEKQVCSEFNDWLVQIRDVAKDIGQLAIDHAASACQRDVKLRIQQRDAEEQGFWGAGDCLHTLDSSQFDEALTLKFDLTPVYRAYHIYGCLGIQEHFCNYYYENRLQQLKLDLDISSSQSFLDLHQCFLAQIVGFFIIEDRVLRTTGGLLRDKQVEMMWDVAMTKTTSLLEKQFSGLKIANHLFLIKDSVNLLAVTLKQYGYQVAPLHKVLDKSRDIYHEFLFNEFQKQIADVLENDAYEPMTMKTENEYAINVLSFNLQPSDTMPAFPYVAPFSSSIPGICHTVRLFIEDSVSYLLYGRHIDLYDDVKRYLDKFLNDVVNKALLKKIHDATLELPQAMQIAVNINILEHACDHFLYQAAQSCGMPGCLVEKSHAGLTARAVLRTTQNAAYIVLSSLVNSKIDEYMDIADNINWTADDVPVNDNEHITVLKVFLDSLLDTAQKNLPLDMLHRVASGAFEHISHSIVAAFLDENVKRFTISAVMGIDNDLKILETYADDKFHSTRLSDVEREGSLRECLSEARQLINLLLSSQPENFINPAIREKSYSALDHKKVASICEKFKDSPDRLFGSLSTRNSKQNARKKSMDTLKRRLKDFN